MKKMKQIAFVLLLLTALTASAQPPNKMVQYLDLSSQKYLNINVTGYYLTVVLYQDTVDYVALSDPLWSDTTMLTHPFFELNSNGPVNMLWVYGHGRNGIVEIHTRRDDLYLSNRYYNHVYVSTHSDTLRYRRVQIQSDDFSMVELTAPLVAEEVLMMAEKSSIIYYKSYTAETYSENTKDHAIIYGGIRNGESQVNKHGLDKYTTDGKRPSFLWQYRPNQRLHFSFTAALLRAGRTTMSGFGWKEDTYPDEEIAFPTMKTALSNYQAEMSYDFVCRKHVALSLGVGYSYNRFKFKDPYLDYLAGAEHYEGYVVNSYLTPMNPHYGGGDSLQFWSTQLTTRYITIPLTLTYYADRNHRKGFRVGLSLLPSFGLGEGTLLSRYCQWQESGNELDGFAINDYHNNGISLKYMTDIRLSIGWSVWSMMVQFSPDWSFSLTSNGIVPAYPFRMGLMLTL